MIFLKDILEKSLSENLLNINNVETTNHVNEKLNLKENITVFHLK